MQAIYCIENLIDNKLYVGSTSNLLSRWWQHKHYLNKNKYGNIYLQRAWNKYGEKNFEFILIEKINDKNKLIEREQYWIDELEVVSKGYNISPVAGSQLGIKRSEETKLKQSLTAKGKFISEITKLKISITLKEKGIKPPSPLGTKQSEKTKLKRAKALTGLKRTDEQKLKMSEIQKGKISHKNTIDAVIASNKRRNGIKRNIKNRKWCFPDGVKCKCDKCRLKRNEYLKLYKRKMKEILPFVIIEGVKIQ